MSLKSVYASWMLAEVKNLAKKALVIANSTLRWPP